MTFIADHGLVCYTPHVGLTKMHDGKPCEGCAKPSTGLDHCHVHGWIRGTLCGRCNQAMQAIDARKTGRHNPALLKHWANCPDCSADGPWSPDAPPAERPHRGRKFSVYLDDELHAAVKATGLPLAVLFRRGLDRIEAEKNTEKNDPATAMARRIREGLAEAGYVIVPVESLPQGSDGVAPRSR